MQKVIDILLGAFAGFLLALGLSRACDRLTGNKTYRYLGSGSPGRRAEDRLWDSGREHLDRAADILRGAEGIGEGSGGEETVE